MQCLGRTVESYGTVIRWPRLTSLKLAWPCLTGSWRAWNCASHFITWVYNTALAQAGRQEALYSTLAFISYNIGDHSLLLLHINWCGEIIIHSWWRTELDMWPLKCRRRQYKLGIAQEMDTHIHLHVHVHTSKLEFVWMRLANLRQGTGYFHLQCKILFDGFCTCQNGIHFETGTTGTV
jgi:hypothetical protein